MCIVGRLCVDPCESHVYVTVSFGGVLFALFSRCLFGSHCMDYSNVMMIVMGEED